MYGIGIPGAGMLAIGGNKGTVEVNPKLNVRGAFGKAGGGMVAYEGVSGNNAVFEAGYVGVSGNDTAFEVGMTLRLKRGWVHVHGHAHSHWQTLHQVWLT